MTTATQQPPRRRFAPVPIETTFEQYRKTGPTAELTPSPSPRSPSPPPREKRKFAPQLVESSVRRSRRAGDEGPATRPTDKTDITPYTKHIYAPKTKKRHGGSAKPPRRVGHARRESCDDEIAGDVFDLVARDAQQKLQEVAMSAFPNSGLRIGGAEHYYVREGSDSDSMPSRGRTTHRAPKQTHSRRNSSEEDLNWAFREMQEHAHLLEQARERVSTLDLDRMSIDGPPSDAMGLTTTARPSLSGSSGRPSPLGPIGETHMPFMRSESPLGAIGESAMPLLPHDSPPIRPIGESHMPYIPSAPPGKAAVMPYAPASQIPQESGFHNHGSPFRRFPPDRDMSLERARNLHRLRANHSPPMLGKDLTFRMCPSPKQTKLEPDHLWDLEAETTLEDPNRDVSGQRGLWRGYCYTADQKEWIIPVERPAMLTTPFPPATPRDANGAAYPATAPILSEEPTPDEGLTRAGTLSIAQAHLNGTHSTGSTTLAVAKHAEHRLRNNEPKGLRMLQGLEEKLRMEKAWADREEQITAEFTDTFVTQVYNYLSLGYPAMARQYDEELSKISHISLDDLERADDYSISSITGDAIPPAAKKVKATGHIILDREEKEGTREEDRCSRWKALKLYIYEWARQHPDLNEVSPLAWGVRERRGSWGI